MIKVGYLISYDYEYVFFSLESVYKYVDKIVFAIDENYKTYAGNDIFIEQHFYDRIKEIDIDKKIEFYYDNFYRPELSPMECETRERNLLLKKMGKGWKIQLDVDEYVIDFKPLIKILRKLWYFNLFPKLTPIQISGKWITLFKKSNNAFYYIDNKEEFTFISNVDFVTCARKNSNIFNYKTNFPVLHQSWARGEDEVYQKLANWSHKDDFDSTVFFDFWKSINDDNFSTFLNFHPFQKSVWNKLLVAHFKNEEELIKNFKNEYKVEYKSFTIRTFLKYMIWLIKKR